MMMSSNRLASALFGASLALALALLVGSHWFDGGVSRVGLATRRGPGTGAAAAAPGALDSPMMSPFDAAAALEKDSPTDGDDEAETAARPRSARAGVFEGPTFFDDAEEKLVTRRSADRPETVRFAARDVDHVERRDGGETVLVLRRGPSVLVTEELLAAAPEDLRDRISYEGPPAGTTAAAPFD